MLIEAFIAHVFADVYCRPSNGENTSHHTRESPFHYLWGTSLIYLILLFLTSVSTSLYWTALFLLLVLGVSAYERVLNKRLNRFLDTSLLNHTNQVMYRFYSKNRGVLLFMLHQLIKILWIISIDYWLSTVRNPLEYIIIILISLMLIGFIYYKPSSHILFNQAKRSNLFQYIALLLIVAAIGLFISFFSLQAVSLIHSHVLIPEPFSYQDSYHLFISGVLILLLLMRPTNRMIRLLSLQYDPKELSSDTPNQAEEPTRLSGFKGAGAMIGNLERLLILLSFLFGSLLSVVAILSIKAFARYKLIAEDPYFSEYFVIGTMLSVLITFACYLLFLLLMF